MQNEEIKSQTSEKMIVQSGEFITLDEALRNGKAILDEYPEFVDDEEDHSDNS